MGTDEARVRALRWKIAAGTAALGIAGGPDPHANLVDFLSLTTVTRMALEEVWVKAPEGPSFQPWLNTSKSLEVEAPGRWPTRRSRASSSRKCATRSGNGGRATPTCTRASSPDRRRSAFSSGRLHPGHPSPGSIFSVVGLDPTAGLDPAVREVTRSRLFAERTMFMAERMPVLLRWEVELIADDLLHQSQVVRAVDTVERISRATESASKTAAELPDRLTAERKAIVGALEAQEGKLSELSANLTKTLDAGDGMSTSLNATLKTFDALMKRFGVGEPAPRAPRPTGGPGRPPLRHPRLRQDGRTGRRDVEAIERGDQGFEHVTGFAGPGGTDRGGEPGLGPRGHKPAPPGLPGLRPRGGVDRPDFRLRAALPGQGADAAPRNDARSGL